MATQRKWTKELAEGRLQMTSMVDVVFLLIIFFMCVTEMSRKEAEASITLPEAIKAVEDKVKPNVKRIVVNVMRDGTYRVQSRAYSRDDLARYLNQAGLTERGADGLSTVVVKVRGDVDAAYKYVQYVLMCCMDAKIWQVSFGVAPKGPRGQ